METAQRVFARCVFFHAVYFFTVCTHMQGDIEKGF